MARTSTTGLLRTQASRQKTIWNQEDQMVDYEWSLSDKSSEALNYYLAHYDARRSSPTATAQDQLGYDKKIRSASKSYISNEIQRQSIDVIEGNISETDKLNRMYQLYNMAVDNEDYDQAQTLRLSIDNQQLKIERAAQAYQAAASAGYAAASSSAKSTFSALISDIKRGDAPLVFVGADGGLVNLPPNAKTGRPYSLNDISQMVRDASLGQNDLQLIAETIYQANPDKYPNGVPTPAQLMAAALEGQDLQLNQMAGFISDPSDRLAAQNQIYALDDQKFDLAGLKLSPDQLLQEAQLNAQGNSMLEAAIGADGKTIMKIAPIQDYQPGYLPNGEAAMIPSYSSMKGEDVNFGVAWDKTLRYYADANGQYIPIREDLIARWLGGDKKAFDGYSKDAKKVYENLALDQKNGRKTIDTYSKDDLLASSGYTLVGDQYMLGAEAQDEFTKKFGFTPAGIKKDAIVIDDQTGNVKFMVEQNGEKHYYERQGNGALIEVVTESGKQFLGGRSTSPTTTSVLGDQMYRDFQTNLPGGAIQKAQNIVQQAGVSGVLQQAANARQLQDAKVASLKVAPLPAPTPIQVAPIARPQTVTVEPRKYVTPITMAPVTTLKLAPVTSAQSTSMTSGGATLQSAGIKLQGGGSIQGGTLRVK